MFSIGVSNRDRAVLLAVADGRVTIDGASGNGTLIVDGLPIADQFAANCLVRNELVAAPPGTGDKSVSLTERGRAVLLERTLDRR